MMVLRMGERGHASDPIRFDIPPEMDWVGHVSGLLSQPVGLLVFFYHSTVHY